MRLLQVFRESPRPYFFLCTGPLLVLGSGALKRWPESAWLVLAVGCIALVVTLHRSFGRKLRLYSILIPSLVFGIAVLVKWPAAFWFTLIWGCLFYSIILHMILAVAPAAPFFVLGQSFWSSSFSARLAGVVEAGTFFALVHLLPATASFLAVWTFPEIIGLEDFEPRFFGLIQIAVVLPFGALLVAFVAGLIFGLLQTWFPNFCRLKLDE
jgi:hypothetical protein